MAASDRPIFHAPEIHVECYDNGEGGVTVVVPSELFLTPIQAEWLAQALLDAQSRLGNCRARNRPDKLTKAPPYVLILFGGRLLRGEVI